MGNVKSSVASFSDEAPGLKVNRTDLSKFFGVSLMTIDNWISKGCPYLQKADRKLKKPWIFNTAQVHEWQKSIAIRDTVGEIDKIQLEDARRRKMAAEAALTELELDAKRGTLISSDVVEQVNIACYTACKTRLLGIPSKLAPILVGEERTEVIKEQLENEIYQALNELSEQYTLDSSESGEDSDTDLSDDEGFEASTEING